MAKAALLTNGFIGNIHDGKDQRYVWYSQSHSMDVSLGRFILSDTDMTDANTQFFRSLSLSVNERAPNVAIKTMQFVILPQLIFVL